MYIIYLYILRSTLEASEKATARGFAEARLVETSTLTLLFYTNFIRTSQYSGDIHSGVFLQEPSAATPQLTSMQQLFL